MAHTGVTVLQFENRPDGYTTPLCLSFSDLLHLAGGGIPVKVFDIEL